MKKIAVTALAGLAGHLMLSSISPAQTTDGAAGTYCLTGVREVGSCIRLLPGGKFQYFLAYGAYDEKSEGRWRIDGKNIVLDSAAYDRKPKFTFKGFKSAETKTYTILVQNKSGNGISGVDIRAKCGSKISTGYTQYDGFPTTCTNPFGELSLGINMIGLEYQPVKVAEPAAGSKVYVYEFDPGDLGKKPFAGVRLTQDGSDTLIMKYGNSPLKGLIGKRLRFQRQ